MRFVEFRNEFECLPGWMMSMHVAGQLQVKLVKDRSSCRRD